MSVREHDPGNAITACGSAFRGTLVLLATWALFCVLELSRWVAGAVLIPDGRRRQSVVAKTSTGRSIRHSGLFGRTRMPGPSGELPTSRPITRQRFGVGTAFIPHPTTTAVCRWGSRGPGDCLGSGKASATTACFAMPERSRGRRSSAWATQRSICNRSTKRWPRPIRSTRSCPCPFATFAAPARPRISPFT